MNRILAVLLVAWALVAVTVAQRSGASIWGTVQDAAGDPVDGALVSIRAVDQTFTTSVFTDESGEYVTPPLPARRYRMWAQAVGFGTARAELLLDGPASRSFALKMLEDFTPQLTGTEWYDALPDATADDRRMKTHRSHGLLRLPQPRGGAAESVRRAGMAHRRPDHGGDPSQRLGGQGRGSIRGAAGL